MKYNRVMSIIISIILFTTGGIVIINNSNYSIPNKIKVGVIDTSLSNEYVLQYGISNIMIDNMNLNKESTHADMVVDIIKRGDSNCEIYLANVLNENNTGNISDVVRALVWLNEKEVDIICMSFATLEDNEQLREIVSVIQKSDIVVVSSCLNYSTAITYPAYYDGVISVANCKCEKASISITNKSIKNELMSTKWKECSTSILVAYITGKISKEMSKSSLNIDRFIQKYNMT